jgi:hypothetical protein
LAGICQHYQQADLVRDRMRMPDRFSHSVSKKLLAQAPSFDAIGDAWYSEGNKIACLQLVEEFAQ